MQERTLRAQASSAVLYTTIHPLQATTSRKAIMDGDVAAAKGKHNKRLADVKAKPRPIIGKEGKGSNNSRDHRGVCHANCDRESHFTFCGLPT